jgi:hypothetical protein
MISGPPETIVAAGVRGTLGASGALPTFAAIDEGIHEPYGITKVVTGQYEVHVYHDTLAGISECQVSSDETLGARDITTHASWGADHAVVTFKRGGVSVPTSEVCGKYANFWIGLSGYRAV